MFEYLPTMCVMAALVCQPPAPRPAMISTAERLWLLGQQAMREGETRRAIDLYEECLAENPGYTRAYLSLAAAYLDQGQEDKACRFLTLYVAAHPRHLSVRAQYAELLHRLRRFTEARHEFENFVAEIQADDRLAAEHLIHCHSRLMQIAEVQCQEYDEHLNRGIGLLLLARQRDSGEVPAEISSESLLCKAAGELALANQARPDEARPCWYLHEVWSELAQSQPAFKYLRAAQTLAPFSYLTPTERRDLHLALLGFPQGRR